MQTRILSKSFWNHPSNLTITGPLLALITHGVILLFDPEAPGAYNIPFVYGGLLACIVSALLLNLKMISGKWSIERWKKYMLSFYYIPLYIGNSYLSAVLPDYLVINIVGCLAGFLNVSGLYTRFEIAIQTFAFIIPLWLFAMFLNFEWYSSSINILLTTSLGAFLFSFWFHQFSKISRRHSESLAKHLRSSRKDKRTIADERKKSDRLLLNILPEQVADELKSKGSTKPVHYDSASVLFPDFKVFTSISETMTPNELIGELDRCFTYFDQVCEKYGLEKLKTIGDSFMCAGGLPEPNQTHAIDCTLAALEMQRFMNQVKSIKAEQDLPYWEIRLGIHSGSLVAGVIGEKKFAYDVWGDTVNTASRMESSGAAGEVNISAETYELIQDLFNCSHRGKVQAKNKGEIDMYFVKGIKPFLSRDGDCQTPNDQFQNIYNTK